jgi:hypothetical protein
MGTAVEDLVRLAWRADGDGRSGTRDALLTLAVAEGLADEPALAERCGMLLTARQPDHWFGTPARYAEALENPRVVDALTKLRATFPPVRVRHLLLRAEAQSGPYTGRVPSLSRIIKRLTGLPAAAVPTTPLPPLSRANLRARSLPFPVPITVKPADPDGELVALYWSILLAMAVLLNSVLEPAARDSRAA